MRRSGATLAAAGVTAAAMIAVALFSAARLADTPIRGRIAGPDPIGSLGSVLAALIGVIAFFRLGAAFADASTARPPIVAGLLGGALAGLVAGAAQAVALSDYLAAVLAGYAVPSEFLPIVLGAYVLAATTVSAAIASGVTYAGWSRMISRSDTPR